MQASDTMAIESKILDNAKALDAVEGEAMGRAIPQGSFTAKGINILVDATNAVLPLFGLPAYTVDPEATSLPPEFVKLITMISEAAKEAGLEQFAVEVAELTDDKALKMAAGKLKSLSGKSEFKRFLKSERPAEAGAGAPVAEEAPKVPPSQSGGEDELMMSRI